METVLTIDGGDLGCARLLLLLRDRVADLSPGTLVHLVTSDPVAPVDLPVWCHMTGHHYRGVVEGAARPTYVVEVAARPAPTDHDNPWRTTTRATPPPHDASPPHDTA